MDSMTQVLIFSSRLPAQTFVHAGKGCEVEIRHLDVATASEQDLGMSATDLGRYQQILFDWSVNYLELDLLYPLEEWSALAIRLSQLLAFLQQFLCIGGAFKIGVTSYKGCQHYDDDAEIFMLECWIAGLKYVGLEPVCGSPGRIEFEQLVMLYCTAKEWDQSLEAPSTKE